MGNSNSDDRLIEFLKNTFKAENLEFEEVLQKLKDDEEFWDKTVGEYFECESARIKNWHGTQDPRA